MRWMARFSRGQRSQAMPEFALVAPVLLLIIFGIFDFGRGIFDYVTIQNAANEGARVAIQGEQVVGPNEPYKPPTTSQVINATIASAGGVKLVAGTCPDGPPPQTPVASATIPSNTGYVFVTNTQPIAPNGWTAVDPGSTIPDAPGGEPENTKPPKGCWDVNPASGNVPLQVSVIYHFSPITPLIGKIIGSDITLVAYSVYETEY